MDPNRSANSIRQDFIDFFVKKKKHKFVPSASLVPGGDATLLFTNAGMVQFKDIFLGTEKREYVRAANSQKCLRVAGKHNDLEDVGFDDTHHTFFEMLGNWSFGDYYKEEAITWAWELLTKVWGLAPEKLYVTVFKDEKGEIPTDDEAFEAWKKQPGLDHSHILYLGRKDIFWEMAETGPCGPSSEIHIDMGPDHGEIEYMDDGQVDLDNGRFLELWNLVFIQFNRTGPKDLEPLPEMHVDTGLGFERIVSVLQEKDSNYRTDLFTPLMGSIQALTNHKQDEVDANFTPYRVIADHARAATFLIADGVVPGNMGRNYVTRMIVRRAARFGSKLGLNDPFLANIAGTVIEQYGEAYPELVKNQATIRENLTLEEERFQRTVDNGVMNLEGMLDEVEGQKDKTLDGNKAFELYATYGLPFEITRDIAQERGLYVDEAGFQEAMETHREASGSGQAMGVMGDEDNQAFRELREQLKSSKELPESGVEYNPYEWTSIKTKLVGMISNGEIVKKAKEGDKVDVIVPNTGFYAAAGGQVNDTGIIRSKSEPSWKISIKDVRQPAAGMISHVGEVTKGSPKVGDEAELVVDWTRRQDIMRNHTATHLLHAELHRVLGEHARQAGSLVAPDRLRFDFTHNEALSDEEIKEIEKGVNELIFENHKLQIEIKPLEQAQEEGAIALFGEKYKDDVRTIKMGAEKPFSYELCGGTHVSQTGEIGSFFIVSEGSVAAGIRRIEAVTGRGAYEGTQLKLNRLDAIASQLKASPDTVEQKVAALRSELSTTKKELEKLQRNSAFDRFKMIVSEAPMVASIPVLVEKFPGANMDILRQLVDRFRNELDEGIAVFAGEADGKAQFVAAVSDGLVEKGLNAVELINHIVEPLGGRGGGRASMAQAGANDGAKIDEALKTVAAWVKENAP